MPKGVMRHLMVFGTLVRDICLGYQKHLTMRLFYTILMMLISSGVHAQELLRFDDAFMLALEHNKLLASKRIDVATAYYELQAARGLYYPKIELTGAYVLAQRDMNINITGRDGILESGANALINNGISKGLLTPAMGDILRSLLSPLQGLNLNYTLQKRSFGMLAAKFTMPIYVGGRINAANRAAKIRLSMKEYELDAAQSHLHTTLVEQYYGVVVLQYAVGVRRDVVRAMTQHLDEAQDMENEGVIAHSEVLGIEYRLAEAQRELIHEEHRLLMAKHALGSTIGLDDEITPIDNLFICDNNILSIDYYINSALNLNSILCGAEQGLELAKEGVAVARAELLPTVAVLGGASLYDYQLSNLLPRWAIGVEASITLFDGLAKERKLRAAKSRVESVVNDIDNGRDEIVLLTENEYYNLCNALADIKASRTSVIAADSFYNSMLDAFRAGVASSSKLLDAEVARAVSKLSLLNAAYQCTLSLARLLEASGLIHTFGDYRDKAILLDI